MEKLYKKSPCGTIRCLEVFNGGGAIDTFVAHREMGILTAAINGRVAEFGARIVVTMTTCSKKDLDWLHFLTDEEEGVPVRPAPPEPMAAGPDGRICRVDGSPYYGRM